MAHSVCGITIVYEFSYRGALEEFSNQYWFSGAEPADAVAWKGLADNIIFNAKNVMPSSVSNNRAYGHNEQGDGVAAVWQFDYKAASLRSTGLLSTSGGTQAPGDSAVWLRGKTGRLSSKGKPIYLRKYFHPAFASTGAPDTVLPAQKTALETWGAKLIDGTLVGSRKWTSYADSSDVISLISASPYVTTRTLKRRGKRPPTSS